MAMRTERVEAPVPLDQRNRIERAAAFAGESMSATVVSADHFDELLAALDEPAEQTPRLAAAAKKARRHRRIRTA